NIKAQNADVIIIDAYKPTISDAFKINDNPKIQDTTVEKLNLNYQISSRLYPTTYYLDPIKPAKMVGEPLTKFYKSYVKAGFGTKTTPLAEIYFNNLRSTDQSIGAYFRHLSSAGKIKDYAFPGFSDNEAVVYASKFYKNHTLSADIDYNRNVVHYYGFNPAELPPDLSMLNIEDKDKFKQRFLKIGGQLKFMSTFIDSVKLNHSFSLSYFNFSDMYKASEDHIGFTGAIDKKVNLIGKNINNQDIGLKADVNYYNDFNKIGISSPGATVRLLPHFSATYDILKFDIGLNTSIEATDKYSNIYLYPDANFNINLYNNILILYGGITSDLKRNNLIDLSSENPFINTYLPLKFTNTRSKIFGGFKGCLSSYLSFNAYISKSKVENLPLFVNDTAIDLFNKFTVIYDKARVINTHTEISYQKTEKIKILLISNFYQYMPNELEAWHKPNMDIKFSFNYNLKNKIILKTDVFAFSRVWAKTYDQGNVPVVKLVPGTVDVNLGLEYRYTKILSAFLNFNNIGAVRYQRWYNYPGYGFTALAGITYAL
ncbi:MAG: hypothetical protein WC599_10395, partial [Bacteroidales bacterium]